jgi:hypothetical protein
VAGSAGEAAGGVEAHEWRGGAERREGFEIGVGPSIVVVDEGVAKTLTTTTAREDVYAFIFGQEGLMAGLGLQGSKITRIAR